MNKTADELKKAFNLGIKHQIFNNELRKRRMFIGLKQKDLAKQIGLPNQRIGALELFRGYPTEEEAKKIADFFHCQPEDIFPRWLEFFKPKRTTVITEHIITEPLLNSGVNPLLITDGTKDIEDRFDLELLKKPIKEILNTLSDREKRILQERFGLLGENPKTLEVVGKLFGVTRDRIRQIEAKALRKLRHPSRAIKVKNLIPNSSPFFTMICPKKHISEILVRDYKSDKTYICGVRILKEQQDDYDHPQFEDCLLQCIRKVDLERR